MQSWNKSKLATKETRIKLGQCSLAVACGTKSCNVLSKSSVSNVPTSLAPDFLQFLKWRIVCCGNRQLIIWHMYYNINSPIITLADWIKRFSLNQQDWPCIFQHFSVTSASSSSIPPTCILWIPSWISTRVCWMRSSRRNTQKALTECPAHRFAPRNHMAWRDMTWQDAPWHEVMWQDATCHDMAYLNF